VYTNPPELRAALQSKLGTFPLFEFWGPRASIRSTEWIAEAAKEVDRRHDATLSLVYLPQLDYPLQKFGTAPETDLRAVDQVCAGLIEYFESRGANVIVLSEYGIRPVDKPVHLNRVLREHGLLTVREELGLEVLDPGASAAFAVADHQVAHVYVNDRSKLSYVEAILENTAGVERVARIAHPRAGDFVAIAEPRAWFTYYYWLDDRRAPDFARTVDIHRKPGYDPVELFLGAPAVTVAWKLLKRKLGFRGLLDVIPLDASLVKGSHGRPDAGPILLMRGGNLMTSILATDVYTLILRRLQNL
jgi:predicted AlkP superfamily pyrophosphatase or phosphodiesterase